MIKLFRSILALLLATSISAPALASTHVIAELGTAPLLGQVESTPDLQTDVTQNEALFARAGRKLGLSPTEYSALRERIGTKRLTYVTIPRHLDAMTWSQNGRVYVLHDVQIPSNTRGWEVDLHENGQILALFIPNKCGNLSLVRRPQPLIAQVPKVQPARVLAARYTPPPAPAAAPMAIATQAPAFVPEAAPQAAQAFKPEIATPAAVSAPHLGFLLPLLGAIAIGFLAGGHGGTSTPPHIGTTSAPPPTPPVGPGCPTPAPSH